MMGELLCVLGVILLVGLVIIATSLRIAPEYQRFVVFRLGRPLDRPRGPGIVFLIPILDRIAKVDLREQMREVSNVEVETKDGKLVSFAFHWYYKVLDPVKSVYVVLDPKSQNYILSNYEAFITDTALKVFQAVIHDVDSSDLVFERERIRKFAFDRLDEIAPKFGVKIVKLEITKFTLKDGEDK